MKPTKFAYGVALLLGGWALNSHALEFRATKEHGTVFYDAPSSTAPKRFVVSRDYPVEVLATKPCCQGCGVSLLWGQSPPRCVGC